MYEANRYGPNPTPGACTPPVKAHWARTEGYGCGRVDDRIRRGFMLFGLAFAADDLTRQNTQQWIEGFCEGQLERGLRQGFKSYDEYVERFVAEVVRRGVWSHDEIRQDLPRIRPGLMDCWYDRMTPAHAVDKLIRPTRD